MKQMTDRERKLIWALHDACNRLDRARTFIENKSLGNDILKHDGRLEYVLRSDSLRKVLKECKTNQIIVTKIDDSTLTRIDVRYVVRVELLNDDLPMGNFSFNARKSKNLESAWKTVGEVSDTLDKYGIDYEVVDETGEDRESV